MGNRIMGVLVAASVLLRALGGLAPLPVLFFTCCSHYPSSLCSLRVSPSLFSFIFILLTPTELLTDLFFFFLFFKLLDHLFFFFLHLHTLSPLNLSSFFVDIWYCE